MGSQQESTKNKVSETLFEEGEGKGLLVSEFFVQGCVKRGSTKSISGSNLEASLVQV